MDMPGGLGGGPAGHPQGRGGRRAAVTWMGKRAAGDGEAAPLELCKFFPGVKRSQKQKSQAITRVVFQKKTSASMSVKLLLQNKR